MELLLTLLMQMHVVTQAAANGSFLLASAVLLPLGVMVSPALLGIVLVAVLLRRELRRQDTGPAQPAPAWLLRSALLFLLFGAVASAPMPRGDAPIAVVSFGGFSAVGAVAILTRSRIWRALALALLLQLLILQATGLIIIGRMASSGGLVVLQSLSLCCYAAGLSVLLVPSSKAAFGIPPRQGFAPTAPRLAP